LSFESNATTNDVTIIVIHFHTYSHTAHGTQNIAVIVSKQFMMSVAACSPHLFWLLACHKNVCPSCWEHQRPC